MCVFVVLWPLIVFAKKHPVNLIILMLFTLSISFAVGLCCSFSKGMVIIWSACSIVSADQRHVCLRFTRHVIIIVYPFALDVLCFER